jgi:putative transposase
MHVHLVFVTKYRRGVFTAQMRHDLRNIFTGVCSDFESQLVEFDGEHDHVHLRVNYPPKITVAALVNSLKGVSSRLIRLKTTRASDACYGASRCGRRATSPETAVAHPSP